MAKSVDSSLQFADACFVQAKAIEQYLLLWRAMGDARGWCLEA